MANMPPYNRKSGGLMRSGDFYNMIDNFLGEPWFAGRESGSFRVDVQQKENEYLIEADLPGVNREEVDLQINEGTLHISVNREENVNDEGKDYIHRERRLSSMSRSIYLGDATAEGIRAKLDNGILKVIVPRQKNPDNSRRIKIE